MRTLNNCPAPAKLNLFLHVTGRRADGYHTLQTAFQLIDRSDLLDFTVRDDGVINRVNEVPGVPADLDLVVRAARLLQDAARERKPQSTAPAVGADIRVHKKLPMGGGLGGGSSDAATTLIVLNHLWNAGLERRELMGLGLQLGADVPFFVYGQNAFAEGVGEALHPAPLREGWFVVVEPGVSIPTAAIFNAAELTRDTKLVKMSDFSGAIASDALFGKNDLQPVACALYPPVAEALKWLGQYGQARMTGSGSCVFCRMPTEAAADDAVSNVPRDWKAWKASALAQHPLAYLLKG
ncbi:MAG: ispE [Herminiimonas sp.]|nr:ispE [Herminiimonas sp.]MDB5853502.1 ispE [Herminiimonas sp.]